MSLTWKMHRFEVVAVVVLMSLVAITTLIVTSHLNDLGLTACWPRSQHGGFLNADCDQLMSEFWTVLESEGTYVRIGLAILAPVVGLVLGIPIVARELETRTTALAWSLQGFRWRWLLARLLPMALVAVTGFIVLGMAGAAFFDSLRTGGDPADLSEVASGGIALVARGLMALAIALLAGAIVGRTLPSFMIAAVVVVAWSALGAGLVHSEMSKRLAVWEASASQGWHNGVGPLAYIDSGEFDVSRQGTNGEPGARMSTSEETDPMFAARCGIEPSDDQSSSWSTWSECRDSVEVSLRWNLIVPASRYGEYVAVDIAFSLLIGGVALLLTFPVVARRRPS